MDKLEVRLQKRMHVSLYALLFLTILLGISILLEGCSNRCETTIRYAYFEPVYKTREDLKADIELTTPQAIKSVGKIYRKDNLLFVSDANNGIHIIDNTNPAQPVKKSFLKIGGNFDMAILGTSLYTDNYTDLVVFDISNLDRIREVSRMENVFNNYAALNFVGTGGNAEIGIITTWEQKEMMEVDNDDCNSPVDASPVYLSEGIALYADASSNFSKSLAIAPGNGSGPGVGGSMARFTIANNHLFILNQSSLQPFDLANSNQPVAKAKSEVGWDIETIFPYGNNLFIGSRSGMHIYDISLPATPQKISTYSHIRSCDPVVVDDKYAYVTLRSGTQCEGFTNQLEVIDIADLASPKLLGTYSMFNPHGLGIDDGTLFICDGEQGLKVYDASDVRIITSKMLAHYSNIHAYDVIPWNDVLVMIGEDGIFQYDYSNPKELKLLSQLSVVNAD